MGWMVRVGFPADTRDFSLLLNNNEAHIASNIMGTRGLSAGGKVFGA
jgi:hypothetical protein